MSDIKIIDAHAHLWLKQKAVVGGREIYQLPNGRAYFMGEERQMLPPFMIDGRNSAEVFLSNMDYAQVSAAVITQEFIDGNQNEYLLEVSKRYPDRFFVCGLCEFRQPGFLDDAKSLRNNNTGPPSAFRRRETGVAQFFGNDGDVQGHGKSWNNTVIDSCRWESAGRGDGRGDSGMP